MTFQPSEMDEETVVDEISERIIVNKPMKSVKNHN